MTYRRPHSSSLSWSLPQLAPYLPQVCPFALDPKPSLSLWVRHSGPKPCQFGKSYLTTSTPISTKLYKMSIYHLYFQSQFQVHHLQFLVHQHHQDCWQSLCVPLLNIQEHLVPLNSWKIKHGRLKKTLYQVQKKITARWWILCVIIPDM